MTDPDVRFRMPGEDKWHDWDKETLSSRCGIKPGREPGKGLTFAVEEVDPQPRCKQCEEPT